MTETQSGLRKSSPERSRRIDIILLAIIFAVGCFLRLPPATFERGGSLHGLAQIHPQPAYTRLGFDEDLYRVYVEGLSKGGLGAYPEIVDEYIEHQKTLTGSILPPVRFLYIFAGYVWRSAFGCDAMTALQQVAAFFSMLTLCRSDPTPYVAARIGRRILYFLGNGSAWLAMGKPSSAK